MRSGPKKWSGANICDSQSISARQTKWTQKYMNGHQMAKHADKLRSIQKVIQKVILNRSVRNTRSSSMCCKRSGKWIHPDPTVVSGNMVTICFFYFQATAKWAKYSPMEKYSFVLTPQLKFENNRIKIGKVLVRQPWKYGLEKNTCSLWNTCIIDRQPSSGNKLFRTFKIFPFPFNNIFK